MESKFDDVDGDGVLQRFTREFQRDGYLLPVLLASNVVYVTFVLWLGQQGAGWATWEWLAAFAGVYFYWRGVEVLHQRGRELVLGRGLGGA